MGRSQRVRARVRVCSRWMLPVAGAAAGVLLSTQAAHATVTAVVFAGSTTTVTSDSPLSWNIANDGSSPISCQLNDDGTPVGVPVACTSATANDVAAQPPGRYSLTVYEADAASVDVSPLPGGTPRTTSATVHVTPLAPQPTAPASPSNDRSPTFGLGLPTDATSATCTLTDPNGDPVPAYQNVSCTDPYTVPLGSSAAEGDYTLAVTATAAGESSDPAQVSYTLDTTAPGPPTVTAPTSPDTDRTPTFTIATGAASVTCTATGPDGPVSLTTPCTTTDATLDLAGKRDGAYTLTVVAHDLAGNDSTPATATYSLDATVTTPTVTAVSPAGKDRSPDFTVTEPDSDADLTCAVTGPDAAAVIDVCDTTSTLDLSGVTVDGIYTLTVTATDAMGNTSQASATYLLDTHAPTAPGVTGPTTGTHKDRHPSFTVTEPDGDATLTCTVTGPDAAATVSACGNTTTLDLSAVTVDGTYTLHVKATDPYGNAVTTDVTYTLDTTAPPAPTVPAPPALTKQTTVTLSITDTEAGVALTCVLTGPSGETVYTGTCPVSGAFSTSGHLDGLYTLVVTATDAAGNSSTTTVSWTRDTAAPPAPSVTPPGSPTRQTQPTVTITDSEPGVTLTCVLTDPDGTVIVNGACPGSFDTAGSNDGLYTLVVTATDAAGNSSTTTVTWTRDTAPPPVPSVTSPGSPTRQTQPTVTISDSESGVSLTCVLTDPDGVVIASGACPGNGKFDTSGSADGLYTLVVTATDAAGNTSTRTVTWTRDTLAPPAPDVSAPPALTRNMSVTLTIADTEPGVALTCLLTGPSGETVYSGTCPANGTFPTNGHIDGLYTLVVTATDAAGNTSTTTVTWTRDSTPPPTPTVTGPASPTRNTAPTATISDSESSATLTCVVTGPLGESVYSGACPGNGVFDTSAYGDGTYTLVVSATDAAGNTSTRTVTWVRDTAPPPNPTVSAPPALTNSKTVTLAITDSEGGVSLTCLLTGPVGELVFSGACPGNGTFNTNGHIDGTFTLVVTATDAAGNTSTTTVSWDRDTTPPPAPTVSAPPALTRNTAVTLTISDSEGGVSLTCLLTGPGGTVSSGACPVGGVFDTTGHGDGTFTLVVTATDAAGNSTTTTVSWVRDTTPPPAPTVNPPADPNNAVHPTVGISDSENGVTLSCVLTGPGGTAFSGACPAGGSFNTTGFGDGTYTLVVTATDAAGNTSTTTVTWVRDTVDPPAPDVSSPPSLTRFRSVTLTIDDTEPGVVLTCVVTSPNGATVSSGLCPANGVFDTTGFGDGTYTLVVTATDAAGNTASTTVSWDRDTTPPPAPTVPAPAALTNSRSVTLTISDTESSATLTCDLTGPGATSVFSGACPSDGVFDTTGFGDGTYTLVVTATDLASNTSTTTVSWVRDTVAPVTPVVQAPNSPAQGRAPSFTVTEPESPVTWTCTVTGPATVTVSQCGLTVVLNLGGAADGVYTLTVTATDPAGNESLVGSATYTLDTTPPPAPVVSAPPALTKSTSVTVTITDAQPDAVLTCVVTSPGGATVFTGLCPVDGTFDTTGFADGVYTLVVTATDSAGNASSTTVTWRRDTQPPPVPVVGSPASPGNTRAPSFPVTEPESPVTYTCTVTGPSTVTVTSCGLTVTLDLTGAADGVYTVFVTATDPAGNESAAGSVSWELDTTPPPAPVVTAPQSPGNDRTPTFTVSDTEAGVHWSCSVSGPGAVAVTSCGPNTTLDMTGAPDGLYTLTVTAIDAAGNISAVGTATYRLDTTPPPAPTVTAPPSPSHDVTPTYPISDAENGVVLTCVLTSPTGLTVFSGTCPITGTFDTTGFPDGVYTLAVTATDAAGNASTKTVTWTKDTVPPPAPGVAVPTSPAQSRSVSFSVTDAESGVTYTCTLGGPSGGTITSCGTTTTISLAGASDGTYTLTVTATDAADNTSTSSSASYTLDTTAPNTPSVSVTTSPAQGRHATFTIGNVEPNGDLTCTLTGPAGSTAALAGPCGLSVGLDLTGQPDGTYTLTVTVTDSAGNVSRAGTASYTLDTTAPAAPSVGSHPGLGHDQTPSFAVSTEAGANLTCTVARYFQTVWSGPCGPGGSVDLSSYDDGEFEITVYATDSAGNIGPPATVVYVLDTTPPAGAVLTAPASPSPIVRPVWVFTIEDETTATCTVTGPDGEVVQGPVQCTSPFTGLFRGLPDGTYTLTVVVTDAAGNDSPPATSTFILDRHAPVPPTVLPPKSPDNDHHPAWTLSAPKGATLTCTLLSGQRVIDGPSACPADGIFSLAGMPDGTYTLRVTATDSAGNISATSVTTYVLDTVAPDKPSLDYSSSASADVHPYWGFSLPPGTVGRCQLWHDGVLLASKNNCKGAVSFDLSGRPAGTYTVRVYAVDGAGNMSHPLLASYVLGTRQPGQPGGATGGSPGSGGVPFSSGGGGGGDQHHTPTLGARDVQQVLQHFTNAAVPVRNAVKKAAHVVNRTASAIIPVIHDQVTEHVSKAVQGVVNAVSDAGGGTGFPLLLLFVVLAFLVMQNRIDRRDPKLALASVAADDTVEFLPPPSRPARRAKGKDVDR